MTYSFKFRTTYEFDEGLHDGSADRCDPTEYVAHLVDNHYRIVVERGDYTAYTELSLQETFNKVMSGEFKVVKEKV